MSAIPTAPPAASSLEDVLDCARLPERSVTLTLDGQAAREYELALAELAAVVDVHGNVVGAADDGSVTDAEVARAEDLAQRVQQTRQATRAASRAFVFRAMAADAWEAFDKRHRDAKGSIRDQRAYEDELIATCSVSPTVTVEEIQTRLRVLLNRVQLVALFSTALRVNTLDGLQPAKPPPAWSLQRPTRRPEADGQAQDEAEVTGS